MPALPQECKAKLKQRPLPSLFPVGRVNKSMSLGEDCPTHTGPLHPHSIPTPVELAPVTPTRWGAGAWSLGFSQGKGKAEQGRGGRPPTPERQENPGRSRDFLDPVDRLWVPCVHAQSPSCAIQSHLIPSHHSPSQPIQRIPHPQVPNRTPYSSTRSIPPPLIRLYGYPCLFSFSSPSTHPPLHFPYPLWPRGFATLRLGDSVRGLFGSCSTYSHGLLHVRTSPYLQTLAPSVDGLKT